MKIPTSSSIIFATLAVSSSSSSLAAPTEPSGGGLTSSTSNQNIASRGSPVPPSLPFRSAEDNETADTPAVHDGVLGKLVRSVFCPEKRGMRRDGVPSDSQLSSGHSAPPSTSASEAPATPMDTPPTPTNTPALPTSGGDHHETTSSSTVADSKPAVPKSDGHARRDGFPSGPLSQPVSAVPPNPVNAAPPAFVPNPAGNIPSPKAPPVADTIPAPVSNPQRNTEVNAPKPATGHSRRDDPAVSKGGAAVPLGPGASAPDPQHPSPAPPQTGVDAPTKVNTLPSAPPQNGTPLDVPKKVLDNVHSANNNASPLGNPTS